MNSIERAACLVRPSFYAPSLGDAHEVRSDECWLAVSSCWQTQILACFGRLLTELSGVSVSCGCYLVRPTGQHITMLDGSQHSLTFVLNSFPVLRSSHRCGLDGAEHLVQGTVLLPFTMCYITSSSPMGLTTLR